MQNILNGLDRYGFGHRAFTEDDFNAICVAEDIEIFWSRKKYAFYFTDPDKDIRAIVLPDRETGLKRLFAMYHELAHHLLHGGDEPCVAFMGLSDSKYESEADAFALVALMPKAQLAEIEIFEDSRFARKLWRERQKILFYYGI